MRQGTPETNRKKKLQGDHIRDASIHTQLPGARWPSEKGGTAVSLLARQTGPGPGILECMRGIRPQFLLANAFECIGCNNACGPKLPGHEPPIHWNLRAG